MLVFLIVIGRIPLGVRSSCGRAVAVVVIGRVSLRVCPSGRPAVAVVVISRVSVRVRSSCGRTVAVVVIRVLGHSRKTAGQNQDDYCFFHLFTPSLFSKRLIVLRLKLSAVIYTPKPENQVPGRNRQRNFRSRRSFNRKNIK